MVRAQYTVENSNLFLILPISFNSTKYIVEYTDNGDACISYGVLKLSSIKIEVFNYGTDSKNRNTIISNSHWCIGDMLALGF